MDDRAAILTGALVGGLIGAALGYLFFTESGRRARHEFEPRMDALIAELRRARGAAARTIDAAGQSWRSVRQLQSDIRSPREATDSSNL
ncbi:MAG: YtxH domain-containing protein [Acidobacteriota bacterium]